MYLPVGQSMSTGMVWLLLGVGLLIQWFVIYAAIRLALIHDRATRLRGEIPGPIHSAGVLAETRARERAIQEAAAAIHANPDDGP